MQLTPGTVFLAKGELHGLPIKGKLVVQEAKKRSASRTLLYVVHGGTLYTLNPLSGRLGQAGKRAGQLTHIAKDTLPHLKWEQKWTANSNNQGKL